MRGDNNMYCRPTKVLPAIVCPTKCCVNHQFENIVLPVVHPSHTTNVNHTNIQKQHHFPHTQSVVNEVTSSDIGPVPGPVPPPTPGFGPGVGPAGMGPGYGPAGMGPGFGPGMGPGFGPGMGPGFGPGMGPGFGPGVGPKRGFFR
jgi:spore coat protein D